MGEKHSPQWEMHHLAFERRQYTTPLARMVRNHKGLIVPAHVINHRLLHIRMKALPVPSNWLLGAIHESVRSYGEQHKKYSTAFQLVGDLEGMANNEHSQEKAEEAGRVAWHLARQLGYVTMSYIDADAALTAHKDDIEQRMLR